MTEAKLPIVLQAQDQVTGVLQKTGAAFKDAGDKGKSGFEKAAGAAKAAVGAVKAVLAPLTKITAVLSALTGGTLAVAIKSAANFGDEIQKMAQRLGLSTETLSALRYQATLSGTDFKAAASGYKILARNLYDAQAGVGEAARAFHDMGLAITDASGQLRPMEDVIGDIADQFKALPDGTEKTALAMKVFSRAGADLIPLLNAGRDGMKEMREEAERLGLVIDRQAADKAAKFNDKLALLQGAIRGLTFNIGLQFFDDLADTFTKIGFWIADHRVEVVNFIRDLKDGAAAIGGSIWRAFGDENERAKLLDFLDTTFTSVFNIAGEYAVTAFAFTFRRGLAALASTVLELFGLEGGLSEREKESLFGTAEVDRAFIAKQLANLVKGWKEFRGEEVRELEETIVTGPRAIRVTLQEIPRMFDSLRTGIEDTVAEAEKRFEDLKEIGKRFAGEMHSSLAQGYFDLVKRDFEDLGEFITNFFRNLMDSVLRIISDMLATQTIKGFSGLLSGLFGGPTTPFAAGAEAAANAGVAGFSAVGSIFGSGAAGLGWTPVIVDTSPSGADTSFSGSVGGGGGGTTVVMNISTIDGDSAAAFFTRNGKTMGETLANLMSQNGSTRASIRAAIA